MTRLLIATRNAHKVGEIRALLPAPFQCLSLRDLPGAPEVVEDAASFAGNALKKAGALARWLAGGGAGPAFPPGGDRWGVLADDSGLEVDALGGAPGVLSARFAALDADGAGNASDAANNAKLLRLLEQVPPAQRTARFRCVLALVEADPQAGPLPPRLFEGVCEGHIGFAPRGRGGFGYDPLFVPEGHEQTFAEMGQAAKNLISHRARALARLREYLLGLAEPAQT